ncbi:MAG: O-antigen ligase family protein [Armatimonadetes bacterium]|nr:O-antigen ligase family protein [Armatimonadota bacterium]
MAERDAARPGLRPSGSGYNERVSVWTQTLDIRRLNAETWRRAALLVTAVLFPAGYATPGAVVLLLTSVILAMRRPGALWHRTSLDIPVGLFLLSLTLSAARSPFPPMAAGSTLLLAMLIILAYGATAAVLARAPGFLTPLLWALGVGTAAAAAWGMVAYLVTGQPAHTAAVGYNAVGTTLAAGLPVLLGLGVRAEGRARIVLAAAAALALIGLALTFARGAWLGGAMGLLLFILMLPRQALRPVLLLLAAVAAVGVLGLANAAGALGQRAESLSDPTAVQDRVAMWRASLAMVRDRPLLGSGLNTFGLVYPDYRLPEDPAPGQPFAHNILLNMAAEGGLLGLATFTAVIVVAAALGLRWLRRSDGTERVRAASVLAAAAALMVHQQLDGTAISFHIGFGLWLLLGIMAARGSAAGGPAATAQAG